MTRRALLLGFFGSAGAATATASKASTPNLEERVGALEQAMNVVWLAVGLDKDERDHPDFGGWYDGKEQWLAMKRAQQKK